VKTVSKIEKQICVLHELQCKAVENGFYGDIGLAETALREKAEREKGCYKCHTKIFTKRLGTGGNGELFGYVELEHKFCPICGRKLGENDG